MNPNPPTPSAAALAQRAAELLTYKGSAYPYGSLQHDQDISSRVQQNADIISRETGLPELLAVLEAAEKAFASWQNEAKDPFDVHFAMSSLLAYTNAARRALATLGAKDNQ